MTGREKWEDETLETFIRHYETRDNKVNALKELVYAAKRAHGISVSRWLVEAIRWHKRGLTIEPLEKMILALNQIQIKSWPRSFHPIDVLTYREYKAWRASHAV